MEPVVYKSKVDTWLWIIIFSIMIISAVICVGACFYTPVALASLILLLLAFWLVIDIYRNTKYTIDGTKLHIKSGVLVDTRCDIAKITEIVETNTLLSSPALSFDRLEICAGKRIVAVISPDDKQGFIAHLQHLNPNIIHTPKS